MKADLDALLDSLSEMAEDLDTVDTDAKSVRQIFKRHI